MYTESFVLYWTEKPLCVIIMVGECPSLLQVSEPIECTTSRVNSGLNYGLKLTMRCRCWPINHEKMSLSEVEDVISGRNCASIGVFSAQLSCEPKTALKQ